MPDLQSAGDMALQKSQDKYAKEAEEIDVERCHGWQRVVFVSVPNMTSR